MGDERVMKEFVNTWNDEKYRKRERWDSLNEEFTELTDLLNKGK